jgi:hypothetical protein
MQVSYLSQGNRLNQQRYQPKMGNAFTALGQVAKTGLTGAALMSAFSLVDGPAFIANGVMSTLSPQAPPLTVPWGVAAGLGFIGPVAVDFAQAGFKKVQRGGKLGPVKSTLVGAGTCLAISSPFTFNAAQYFSPKAGQFFGEQRQAPLPMAPNAALLLLAASFNDGLQAFDKAQKAKQAAQGGSAQRR